MILGLLSVATDNLIDAEQAHVNQRESLKQNQESFEESRLTNVAQSVC